MGPEGGFTRHKHGWLRAGTLGASTGVPPRRRRSRGWAKPPNKRRSLSRKYYELLYTILGTKPLWIFFEKKTESCR